MWHRLVDRFPAAAGWAAILLFAILAFGPALSVLPVTDRDEALFAQASRQMITTQDFVDIRFQDEPRFKKPIGIYWLQSASVWLTGQGAEVGIWAYRLPSLLGAVLSVIMVVVAGTPLFGRRAALLAAAVFAAGFVIAGEARLAKTDATLLATVLIAQAVLARLYLQAHVGQAMVYTFWLALAAGILVKGPIGPMVPALTILSLVVMDRRADWLRPLLSPVPIVLGVAVALPWFVAITIHSDGAFWSESVGADMLAKVASGQEGKGAPPGSYFVAMWFTFWPATPLLALALPNIWRARYDAATRFCLAWIVLFWLLFEGIPTKLIHYTLPTYPALALLAVAHLPATWAEAPKWARVLAGFALLPGFATVVVFILLARHSGNDTALWLAGMGLALAVAGTVAGLWIIARRGLVFAPAFAALAGCVLHVSAVSALARMPTLWPTEGVMALAETAAAGHGCDRPRVTGWGYAEPSLVWRGGRDTRLFPDFASASTVIDRQACSVLVISRSKDNLPAALAAGCTQLGTVTGTAIGAGRFVTLDVLDCHGLS